MWMSEAPSFAACVSRAFSMRMIGASFEASSKSSMAGSSCIIRERSTALSTSPITVAALDSLPAYATAMRFARDAAASRSSASTS